MTSGWTSLPAEVKEVAEANLTQKQLDVFKLWMNGHSDDSIADVLGKSRTTIREHRKAALRKLHPYIQRRDAA